MRQRVQLSLSQAWPRRVNPLAEVPQVYICEYR